jgi:hypothetical protein
MLVLRTERLVPIPSGTGLSFQGLMDLDIAPEDFGKEFR